MRTQIDIKNCLKVLLLMGLFSTSFLHSETRTPGFRRISESTWKTKNNIRIRYALAQPNKQKDPFPLVVALHYGWKEKLPEYYGEEFMRQLILPAFAGLNSLIVAPDCPGRSWSVPESEEAVLELIDHLKKKYKIDPLRIVLTGFSLGGMGTWHLSRTHPELWSAAVIVSGWLSPEWETGPFPVPLYIIHSRTDEVFPYNVMEAAVEKMKQLAPDMVFIPLEKISHYQTERFIEPLKQAVPWIQGIWKNRTDEKPLTSPKKDNYHSR